MSIVNSKLAFEKTTIRRLTDSEIDDVAGGTWTVTFSSEPCAQAIAAAALAAYLAYQKYA